MTITYMDEGMKLIQPHNKNREGDREAFASDVEVGGVMNGKMTPIIPTSD